MEEYDIDPEVLAGFIDETLENLQAVEQMFINLEENPDDIEIVNSIFRPIHSLKGTSGFFGLLKTKELSHSMENLLDAVRKGEKRAAKKVIDALLPGIDLLNIIFHNVRLTTQEIIDESQYEKYEKVKSNVDAVLNEKEQELYITQLSEISKLDEAAKQTSFYDSTIQSQSYSDTSSNIPSIIQNIIEKLHIIRPIIPDDKIDIIDDAMELFFAITAQNEIKEFVNQEVVNNSENSGRDILNQEDEIDVTKEKIGGSEKIEQERRKDSSSRREGDRRQGDRRENERRKDSSRRRQDDRRIGTDRVLDKNIEPDKTMRVSEKSIDSFLEYVGELVVVEEMFNYLQKKFASLSLDQNIAKNFKRVIETFSNLSDSLRNSILEIRSVPAQVLLQKAPRIIRSVADGSGKQVEVIIEGNNIKIDKSYVELLDAPLTHIIRNAVDHGIELPSERAAAGKPEKGSVKITVQENIENIELIVSEDGRGLNLAAISEKALEMGLIGRGQKLDENKIIELLFMSGVSTAKEVTEVSGRGVGMDVVKKNIDSAGGIITVDTAEGKGTTFKITLPKSVSTQIVDGFLVKSGNETYVLPMDIVGESFVPEKKDITTIKGKKGEVVMRRGLLMPVFHLSKLLLGSSNINNNDCLKKVMITIEMNGKNYALSVDDILGVQKVVVKNVEALPVDADCFEGAAMMGDGSVAMIISIDGLQKLCFT